MPLISSPGNPASQWFQRLTGRLGIGSKISYGYGIALGVAIVGTSIGIAAGGYYQTRAVANEDEAWQEIVLLNQLQTRLLQTQMHQQQIVASESAANGFAADSDASTTNCCSATRSRATAARIVPPGKLCH